MDICKLVFSIIPPTYNKVQVPLPLKIQIGFNNTPMKPTKVEMQKVHFKELQHSLKIKTCLTTLIKLTLVNGKFVDLNGSLW